MTALYVVMALFDPCFNGTASIVWFILGKEIAKTRIKYKNLTRKFLGIRLVDREIM
jgi:hypothetical protein